MKVLLSFSHFLCGMVWRFLSKHTHGGGDCKNPTAGKFRRENQDGRTFICTWESKGGVSHAFLTKMRFLCYSQTMAARLTGWQSPSGAIFQPISVRCPLWWWKKQPQAGATPSCRTGLFANFDSLGNSKEFDDGPLFILTTFLWEAFFPGSSSSDKKYCARTGKARWLLTGRLICLQKYLRFNDGFEISRQKFDIYV